MTRAEANQKLTQAYSLIFEVEREFVEREFPRLHGYRARIEVGNLQNAIREREETNISEPKVKL